MQSPYLKSFRSATHRNEDVDYALDCDVRKRTPWLTWARVLVRLEENSNIQQSMVSFCGHFLSIYLSITLTMKTRIRDKY
jgi:hypothetical protein